MTIKGKHTHVTFSLSVAVLNPMVGCIMSNQSMRSLVIFFSIVLVLYSG